MRILRWNFLERSTKISFKYPLNCFFINQFTKKLFLIYWFGMSQHVATYTWHINFQHYMHDAICWNLKFWKKWWFYEFLKKLAKSQEKHVFWMILKFESQILCNYFFIFTWKFLISSGKNAKFQNFNATRHPGRSQI